jgi:hypothetical protein
MSKLISYFECYCMFEAPITPYCVTYNKNNHIWGKIRLLLHVSDSEFEACCQRNLCCGNLRQVKLATSLTKV